MVTGRVASGTVRPGMALTIAPSGVTTEAVSIEMHHEPINEALSGSIISIHLKDVSRDEVMLLAVVRY